MTIYFICSYPVILSMVILADYNNSNKPSIIPKTTPFYTTLGSVCKCVKQTMHVSYVNVAGPMLDLYGTVISKFIPINWTGIWYNQRNKTR